MTVQSTHSPISVVIPVYNGEKHIVQAVRSVWAQDYEPLEIIVVDDGSGDRTVSVVESLTDRGPLRLVRQTHAGRSAARNRGIRESHGEWIAFLDADDFWLPDKLARQMMALEQDRGEFAFTGTVVLDDLGNFVRNQPAAVGECLLCELVWGTRFATSTVIARTSLLEQSGGFDEALSIGEDWDLWLRLAFYGRVSCVASPLVGKRHGDWDGKGYSILDYEKAVPRVLSRFFDLVAEQDRSLCFCRKQTQIWSWHYAVLAKSFFHHRNLTRAGWYAGRSLAAHPAGLRYILPKAVPG